MIHTAKRLVFELTNHAQLILSYLELEEPDKALEATKESIRILHKLTNIIDSEYIGVERRRTKFPLPPEVEGKT